MRYKSRLYLAVSMRSMGTGSTAKERREPWRTTKRGAEANFDPSVTESAYDYLRMRANWAA